MRPFESVPTDEAAQVQRMIDALKAQLTRDYPTGITRRDAHTKTLALVDAELVVEANLPNNLRVGVFAEPRTFGAQIRFSTADGRVLSDARPVILGCAIKLDTGGSPQDFLLMNGPTMPLGTVTLFHDAVTLSLNYHPAAFAAKLLLTGQWRVLKGLKDSRKWVASPLDVSYWSTTPYRFGPERAVKYKLVPTLPRHHAVPSKPAADYLTQAVRDHLSGQPARFDFLVQCWRDAATTPIEDAAVRWDEAENPFVKVATLRIAPQACVSEARTQIAERLQFSPAHAWVEHAPLGGLNRARVQIYREMAPFRLGRSTKG